MPIDVGAQLQESGTLLRRALGEEIAFSLEIEPGLPLATADAAQLEAAVLNLTINARDAIVAAMAAKGVPRRRVADHRSAGGAVGGGSGGER